MRKSSAGGVAVHIGTDPIGRGGAGCATGLWCEAPRLVAASILVFATVLTLGVWSVSVSRGSKSHRAPAEILGKTDLPLKISPLAKPLFSPTSAEAQLVQQVLAHI